MSGEYPDDERWMIVRVTTAVSIASTLVLLGLFAALAYGCDRDNRTYEATYRACVQYGGTFISGSGRSCVGAKESK